MMKRLVVMMMTLPLIGACGKSQDASGTKAENKVAAAAPASASAPAPAAEAPIALTETADLGKAITDPDEKSFVGLKAKTPKGATIEAGLTGVTIKVGDSGFEIAKEFEPGAVAKAKDEAKADTLDKLVKLHLDTPSAILWETASELGGPNDFQFAAEVKVGDATYKCGSKGWGKHTKAQAEALLASCQSVTK